MYGMMRHNHGMNAYNPFQALDNFERDFFSEPFGSFFDSRDLTHFKTDITDEGDNFLLEADLPGFDKKDIQLNLNGDILTIQAQRQSKVDEKDDKVIRMERSFGTYTRQFNVDQIDTANIKAAYTDGVLSVTLPKKTPAQPESRTLQID